MSVSSSVRILGPVEAWAGDQRLVLQGPRQLGLFAFLVCHCNRAVSVDALIDGLWGGERTRSDKRVQMAVSRLRQTLEPLRGIGGPSLQTVSGGYLFAAESTDIDAAVFDAKVREGQRALDSGDAEQASELLSWAITTWRGPPLAEVAFTDFAQAEIRRLEELHLVAHEARFDAELRLGRHAQVTGELEELVARQPDRERLAAQLMLALYRCGRQADALEVYQRTRGYLMHELGLQPGPALQALQVQILEQAPSLGGDPGVRQPDGAAEPRPVGELRRGVRRDRPRPSLFGRESELAEIDELVAHVAAGSGAAALVEGPAGIGKTALLAEMMRRATDRGFAVLSAVGARLEQDYAFGLTRQLFAPIVAPGRYPEALLAGAAGLAAAPLGLEVSPAQTGAAWGDPGSAAMHGLYWLTARLAEARPVLLVVDDTHWADLMSLRFLAYLARRLEGVSVLVLIGARPATEHADELLEQIRMLPDLVTVTPGPLTEPEIGRMLAAHGVPGGDDGFVATCRQATDGNPFLLSELVKRLRAEGATGNARDAERIAGVAPGGVIRWVNGRLAALGGDAQRLAAAYAVFSAGASLADAARLARLDAAAAPAAADALIGASVLTAQQPYDFIHPLVRAAVYDALAPAGRADAHQRVAHLLDARGEASAVVAAHLLRAEPGEGAWTIDALRRAAREAIAGGAPKSAAAYLERALREQCSTERRGALLVELAEAHQYAGSPEAVSLLRRALALYEPGCRGEIYLRLGRAMYASGDFSGAREAFADGLADVADHDDDLCFELSAWSVTDTHHELERPAAFEARMTSLVTHDLPGRTRTERFLLAHLAMQGSRSGARPATVVADLARRALAHGALLRESGTDVGPYSAACLALVAAGRPAEAVAELDRAIRASQRSGSAVAYAWFSFLRGLAQYLLGAIVDAAADLENAWAAYDDAYGYVLPDLRGALATSLLERGDLAGAEVALTVPEGQRQQLVEQPSAVSYLFGLGRLQAERGEVAEALGTLLSCEPAARAMNAPNPAANFAWRSEAALMAHRLGDPERARSILGDTVDRARGFGAPHALGIALRASGLIEGGDRGLEQLSEAVTVLDASGARLQLARALTAQGSALRRAGRRRDAIGPLRRAVDLAGAGGALVLADEARQELAAAGARPRRERSRGADALTASEARVAQMVARGLTNPQIAQDLFVTGQTVETQLTSIYRKLDVDQPEHLSDALAVGE